MLKHFTTTGRVNRLEFLLSSLTLFCISLFFVWLLMRSVLLIPTLCIMFYLYAVQCAKRVHDLGYHGAWGIIEAFLMIIPLVNIILIIQLYCMKGTKGTNQYGEPSDFRTDKSQKTFEIIEVKKELKDELMQGYTKNIKSSAVKSNSSIIHHDDSIIDVTDQSYQINLISCLKKYGNSVPYWAHHYVYSYSELGDASFEQKRFYFFFKNKFLNGEYLNLEGNTNYAFILLFNLLNEYESHKDIAKLEKQLQTLGQNYPKTKSYCNSFLIKRMREKSVVNEGAWNLQEEKTYSYQSYDYDYWRLGNKYKDKLNLDEEQVKLLNKLWSPSNNFCSIEYCLIETIKLFISLISDLKDRYKQDGTNIDMQFTKVAGVIARNYDYNAEQTINYIYDFIFKYCENTVRERYGHKRKLNVDYYSKEEAKTELETKILSKIRELLPSLISKVSAPDEATEIELNYHNTTRWKIKFEELTSSYNGNPKEFVDSINSLATLNKKIPAGKYIFFEASKFITKHDKETALILYVQYVFHVHSDSKFASFGNTPFPKNIQKSLFKTDEQLQDFEKIVSELINDKNLDKALKAVPKVYEVKRKKIKLDTISIREVKQQHFGTVELLNEYLKDDDENNISIEEVQIADDRELKIEITPKTEEIQNSINIAFTQIQTSTLDFFVKSNFSVLQSEFETFVKSKGLLKNQLIESLNDICYEHLDDILIEEDDEYYTINPDYYQTILEK